MRAIWGQKLKNLYMCSSDLHFIFYHFVYHKHSVVVVVVGSEHKPKEKGIRCGEILKWTQEWKKNILKSSNHFTIEIYIWIYLITFTLNLSHDEGRQTTAVDTPKQITEKKTHIVHWLKRREREKCYKILLFAFVSNVVVFVLYVSSFSSCLLYLSVYRRECYDNFRVRNV